jgi:hypothetical protein
MRSKKKLPEDMVSNPDDRFDRLLRLMKPALLTGAGNECWRKYQS